MNVYTKLYSERMYNLKSVPMKKEESQEEQKEEKSAAEQTMQLPDEKSTNLIGADLVADMNKNMMIMIEKKSLKGHNRAKNNEGLKKADEANIETKAMVIQDRANEATGEGIQCTLQELVDENNSIWDYVRSLLEQYEVNYNDNFNQIGDGSSNPANIPIMAPLAELRSILITTPEGNEILQELNERVRIYLEKLVYYHRYVDIDPTTGMHDGNINKNRLKHPMHFGIWVTLCGN